MRRLAGPFFVFAGLMHFAKPRMYEAIMPPYLPAHRELVLLSGAAEIAGGLALMHPDEGVRRAGGWWTVTTLLGVFPANVHMALHPDKYPKVPGGRTALYARLPVQALFAAWAVLAARR